MSPRIASASDIRPPAPIPWIARNAASMYTDVANEHSSDPARNTVIAVR